MSRGKRLREHHAQPQRGSGLKVNQVSVKGRPASGYPLNVVTVKPAHPLHKLPESPAEYRAAARRAKRS